MTDKSSIQQVLGCLIKHPQFLSEVDKYTLTITDFSNRFERYIFSAIWGLYKNGAAKIEPVDIVNFLESNESAKVTFEKGNGLEYLQDIIELSSTENFPYYYNRLKKFNLLRDLKKQGIDVSEFYDENLADPKSDEINKRFELLTVKDICDGVKKKVLKLESDYVQTEEVKEQKASDGMRDFLEHMADTVDIGASVQGKIYNQIINGAEKGALTIRSAASGVGKTRQALGDACYLAYPIRYDAQKRKWITTGGNEKVLFIVTEQSFAEVKKMILAYLSDINQSRFKLGNFSKEENEVLNKAVDIMEKYEDNMILLKVPNPTIELVKTLTRENCLTKDISYVFYDYIFIGPALLNEFKGFALRDDEILLMFATALKDLAVELNVAMFTSTQVNAKADDNKNIRNEGSLAGGRATINKADNGAIMARPTQEEMDVLQPLVEKYGKIPNVVTDIFKVRNGEWTQVRIWSIVNLGTLKKEDLFLTDSRLDTIEGFYSEDLYEVDFTTDEEKQEIINYTKELNGEL